MPENNEMKKKLESELQTIRFTKQRDVLQSLKCAEQKSKWYRFWNKEISIPVIPISTICVSVFVAFSFIGFNAENKRDDDTLFIEFGGSTYLSQQFKKEIGNEN
ncbi:hypothetical protein [Oceanobacillus sp. J11TS1]|uniref:hypothetical protein n=1 Tax=Oceanobacillus sp. J11TS1 TaxID=2807191 RepID=UPI001B019F62|nr:hypothetical protein [Oceanobacillus sp. J11TS1]GIO21679.1 hypothetical protein J11TS1_02600 [Oceanobacillus sp. J11TS1]